MSDNVSTLAKLQPIGSGFSGQDEALHAATDDPYWQESFWVYWGDGKSAGGCIHVGQEINGNVGNIWASFFADGIAYRRVAEDLALDADLGQRGGHGAGGYTFTPGDGVTSITAIDDQLRADLTFTDLLPYPSLLPMFPAVNDPARLVSGTHYQTPGNITGTLRLGSREISIDANAMRGHSWGPRNHGVLRGHGSRWITGAFGSEIIFSAYAAIRNDGSIIRTGYVIVAGTIEYTGDIGVIVELDLDGVSYTGGMVTMKMPSGKTHEFRCVFDNVNLFQHHGIELTVTGGRLIDHEGREGWCAWEIKDRPPSPLDSAPFSTDALVTDGLHKL